MANASLISPGALSALLAIFMASPAHGCGGWDEEPAPLLPYYLGQLPAKSFGDVYRETRPARTAAPAFNLNSLANKIIADLATEKRETLLQWIDEALLAAREQYETAENCNFLHDFRDAVASPGSHDEVADYLRWRFEHAAWFYIDKPKTESYPEKTYRPALTAELKAELEQKMKVASPALRPQWMYARAALDFIQGDRGKCGQSFERVWQEYPMHPRAEIALYMSARCLRAVALRSIDDLDYDPHQSQAEREVKIARREQQQAAAQPEAVAQFERYLAKYPQGRFAADAHGWLGGLKLAQNERLAALQHYTAQLEMPGHPEVAKSALFMCEEVLADAKADEDTLLAEVARHPVAAMGMTYLVLNTADAQGPEQPDEPDGNWSQARAYALATSRTKQWRQVILPKLAGQVVAQKELYTASDWPPRYLAMLAQAASAAGKQAEAIALSELPSHGEVGSDDLLLARATAQQRAGQAAEAISTYRSLLAKFPQSPLARGVRLKLALALQDHHEAGAAWFALRQLHAEVTDEKNEVSYSAPYPPPMAALTLAHSFAKKDISAAEAEQIEQIIEAQANFAPLGELSAALFESSMDEQTKLELRALIAQRALAQRALAQEDFAQAKQFMSPAQFALDAGPLSLLMAQLQAAKTPAARAQTMEAMGDAWAKLRGQTLARPLSINLDEQHALRLRVNGQALGCARVNEELEERDELRHASRWWMRAARALPGTPLAATARWKALDALPHLAAGSQFGFTRAVETHAGKTSRELCDRLRQECPGSREAREYATYWSFPQPSQALAEGEFFTFKTKGDRDRDAIGKMGCTAFDYGAFGATRDFVEDDEDSGSSAWGEVEQRVRALQAEAIAWDTPRLLSEVQDLQTTARGLRDATPNARYFNLLDDLASFLQSPQLSHPAQIAYVELRLRFNRFLVDPVPEGESAQPGADGRLKELLAEPALQPCADYVDFIQAVREGQGSVSLEASDVTKEGEPLQIASPDYAKLQAAMVAYLRGHPHSPKREAAGLLGLRAAHWLATPFCTTLNIRLPASSPTSEEGADFTTELKTLWRAPFDPKPLRKLLAEYDREFPRGYYAAEVANYRADLLWRTHEWGPALDLTLQALDDHTHPDLQSEAALRLANIFAELSGSSSRAGLLAAIRERPPAGQRLQQYLAKTWTCRDHPLRYLGQYLGDQLGFAYTEPPPEKDL